MADAPAASDGGSRSTWAATYRSLVGTDHDELEASDLEALAVSAYLIGDDDTCARAWESAHKQHLESAAIADAARCSFWLALTLMLRGQMAHAGGWLTRTEEAIAEQPDCPATGYLLIPAVLGALDAEDATRARDLAIRAAEIAARFDDPDLAAFSTLGHGQALVALGDVAGGLAKFDDVMLSVEAGDVGPITTGIVYCAVVLGCMEVFDLARASEWTDSLDGWCRDQPELVPYRGQCLVHQSQLRQASGDWTEAAATVAQARERLSDPPHPALGMACYQQAELHRMVGAMDAAADAYAQALRAGYEPMPGLALLELARGNVEAAAASIRRALHESARQLERAPLLAAAVEILRAASDPQGASDAAHELDAIARGLSSEVLDAMADQASGAVLLDEGDISGALARLRSASATWQRLGMPYEAARAGLLVGLGLAALGDSTTAALELENARAVFESLGATPDLERLAPLVRGLRPRRGQVDEAARLSARELEVLAQVAAGKTNPQIATEMSISQHTVRRHLENIFTKIDVSSRAAATAYAYEHDLL